MNYIVNSFTPKKFASRYDKTLVGSIPETGGCTVQVSSTTDLDSEGNLIIDTGLNKWEGVFYESKDDVGSTITIPSWGRGVRGNITSHESGASVRAVSSAETLEYFDRNHALIQQGQIIWKEALDIKILPFNGTMGTSVITYAGSDMTVTDDATTYIWIDSDSALQTSTTAYASAPIVKLGRCVAVSGVITTIYDDRLLDYGFNATDVVTDSNKFIATAKAVFDYVASYFSSFIETVISTPTDLKVPSVKAVMDYMTEISAGVISVNGKGGAISLEEGGAVSIVESPDRTFTISVANATTANTGTVKIDSSEVDPVVILKSTYDTNQGERILESQIFN